MFMCVIDEFQQTLITRKKENDEWTEEFIKLTKDFYL